MCPLLLGLAALVCAKREEDPESAEAPPFVPLVRCKPERAGRAIRAFWLTQVESAAGLHQLEAAT